MDFKCANIHVIIQGVKYILSA